MPEGASIIAVSRSCSITSLGCTRISSATATCTAAAGSSAMSRGSVASTISSSGGGAACADGSMSATVTCCGFACTAGGCGAITATGGGGTTTAVARSWCASPRCDTAPLRRAALALGGGCIVADGSTTSAVTALAVVFVFMSQGRRVSAIGRDAHAHAADAITAGVVGDRSARSSSSSLRHTSAGKKLC